MTSDDNALTRAEKPKNTDDINQLPLISFLDEMRVRNPTEEHLFVARMKFLRDNR
ncbi:MAG: hypothetical protein NWE89_04165 [Candidatus Bathyarchaeota archaeon]|nr:hypothetical protein [Candidatus Bathyarchaeota archaeon]